MHIISYKIRSKYKVDHIILLIKKLDIHGLASRAIASQSALYVRLISVVDSEGRQPVSQGKSGAFTINVFIIISI